MNSLAALALPQIGTAHPWTPPDLPIADGPPVPPPLMLRGAAGLYATPYGVGVDLGLPFGPGGFDPGTGGEAGGGFGTGDGMGGFPDMGPNPGSLEGIQGLTGAFGPGLGFLGSTIGGPLGGAIGGFAGAGIDAGLANHSLAGVGISPSIDPLGAAVHGLSYGLSSALGFTSGSVADQFNAAVAAASFAGTDLSPEEAAAAFGFSVPEGFVAGRIGAPDFTAPNLAAMAPDSGAGVASEGQPVGSAASPAGVGFGEQYGGGWGFGSSDGTGGQSASGSDPGGLGGGGFGSDAGTGDPGYAFGGYTGAGEDGVVQPWEPAGTVHEGEVVVPAWAVDRMGGPDGLLSLFGQGPRGRGNNALAELLRGRFDTAGWGNASAPELGPAFTPLSNPYNGATGGAGLGGGVLPQVAVPNFAGTLDRAEMQGLAAKIQRTPSDVRLWGELGQRMAEARGASAIPLLRNPYGAAR